MIVWLNGAFGAGKTTVAAELCRRLPGARRFDPEWVDNHGRSPAEVAADICTRLGLRR
ncbi:hypothetical protein AB0F73_15975 [Micromonospora purpureochromogenes]|uniref:hypothetical protein n=1 Tax=Micromonospora purpureochromogenes TaxID=47872 RepID=UPI0033CA9E92